DAAGMEKAAVMSQNEGSTLSALFAATHPERVSHLVLYGPFATTHWDADYPWGQKPEERDEQIYFTMEYWGTSPMAQIMFDTDDPNLLEWGRRWQRNSMSPD